MSTATNTGTLQFRRKYALTLGNMQSGEGVLINHLQIRFDGSQSADNKKKGNSASIEVYNLSQETLAKLDTPYLSCSLSVAYGNDDLKEILTGNVVTVTTRQHGPDLVTQFIVGEGYTALNHQRLKSLVPAGKTVEDVVEEIRKQMPNVARGAYVGTNLNNPVIYGYPLNGTPKEMLDRLGKEQRLEWRVIDNALWITEENGVISKNASDAIVLNESSGLIEIPFYTSTEGEKLPKDKTRKDGVQFKALLNPALAAGKLIKLESKFINGFYRITDVRYSGDYRGTDWYIEGVAARVDGVVEAK